MATKQAKAEETYTAAKAVLDYLAKDAPGFTTVTAFVNTYEAARRKLALHVGPLAAKATRAEIERALARAVKLKGEKDARYFIA